MAPSRNPEDLAPLLRDFWFKLKARYEDKFPARRLFLTTTYRSPEEQLAIFRQNGVDGHILTKCDGFKIKSKHNYKPSHAFDFAVSLIGGLEGPKTVWDEKYYKDAADLIKELGMEKQIRSGGWFTFRDWPHMEIFWPAKP